MSITLGPEINIKNNEQNSGGQYQYKGLVPQGGVQVGDVTNGEIEVIVEIPGNKTYNFFRSFAKYTLTPAATAGKYNYIHADTIPEIKEIILDDGSQSGRMVEVIDADYYLKEVLRYETRLDELLNNNKSSPQLNYEGLMLPSTTINVAGAQTLDPQATTLQYNFEVEGGCGLINSPLTPIYSYKHTVANEAQPVVNRKIPLNLFKHASLFAVDKDVYVPYTFNLRIKLNPARNIGFCVDNAATDLVNGHAPIPSYTITNFKFYIAEEINSVVHETLKNSYMNNTQKLDVTTVRRSIIPGTGNGTVQTFNVKYEPIHGHKLRRIYWSVFSNQTGDATVAKLYDNTNSAYNTPSTPGTKVVRFKTMVDGTVTNPDEYDCTTLYDYNFQKEKLIGSCINSYIDYYRNWTWVERFDYNHGLFDKPEDFNSKKTGWDLMTSSLTYSAEITLAQAAQYRFYVYGIIDRTLNITKDQGVFFS